MSKVLITGATGTVGREIVRALAGRSVEVLVGTRDPSQAAPAGARLVKLDWADPSTFAPALAGVDSLFLLTPFIEDFETPARALLAAAKAAGVSFVLKLSASGVSEDGPFEGSRQHARLERAIAESGVGWAVLRPTFFMSNPLHFQRDSVLRDGAFYGASGGQRIAYVSPADIGATAAAILVSPAEHRGRTYQLTGPEALTDEEVARQHEIALGRPVRFVDLPLESYAAGLAQQGMPGWVVQAMSALEGVKRNGWAAATSPDVAAVLGRSPETLASWLGRTKQA